MNALKPPQFTPEQQLPHAVRAALRIERDSERLLVLVGVHAWLQRSPTPMPRIAAALNLETAE
jgi:hypothetical protein